MHTIHHAKATRKALTILKRKGCVAVLVDQHPGRDGIPVPLLGQTACTVRAVAGLQERTRARVVSACAILGSDGVYDVYLAVEPFELDGLGREARLSRIQERHNEIIGEWIRERPEHWFGWFHRRFKPFLEY